MQTYGSKQHTHVQKKGANTSASIFDNSSRSESLQRKADLANVSVQREKRPNNTGMPDNLKAGIECLSGFSMDNVRVHYNSSKPATVQALAYTQGTDIHVAPGQEKCLPHEAWHVAQQMAGRVSPTTNINGMPVNDNAALEHDADVMGEKAVQCKTDTSCGLKHASCQNTSLQRYVKVGEYVLSKEKDGIRKIAVKENEASTIYIMNGCSIPENLKKLGLKKNGTEDIIVDGKKVTYQKIQQGRIDSVRFKEGNKEHIIKQPELNAADKETSKSLLKDQLYFVNALNDFCKDGNFEDAAKRIYIKHFLEFMIDMMKKSVSLKCIGSDIIDAVFAMYHIACKKDNLNTLDKKSLCVIKEDLNLRLSQINNGLKLVHLKPLVQTECVGSAVERSKLMNEMSINDSLMNLLAMGRINYVAADFKRHDFEKDIGWTAHKGSCIDQNLSDDCLYIEDAVGKTFAGKERANAHWFAHIYGIEEPAVSENVPVGETKVFPYPLGESFPMNNFFNSVPKNEKPQSILDKCGKNWEVCYNKKIKIDKNKNIDLDLHLLVNLDENCEFIGLFDRFKIMIEGVGVKKIQGKESNKIFNEYHNYLVGVMDFMVKTANSAIDGSFIVGDLAKRGLAEHLNHLNGNRPVSGEVQNPNNFITKNLFTGDRNDMSLLSIYKANQTSQK